MYLPTKFNVLIAGIHWLSLSNSICSVVILHLTKTWQQKLHTF